MTQEQAKIALQGQTDSQIQQLLLLGGLSVIPYDRAKAIDKIAGLDGGCEGCNKSSNRATVNYVNGTGKKEDCSNCKK